MATVSVGGQLRCSKIRTAHSQTVVQHLKKMNKKLNLSSNTKKSIIKYFIEFLIVAFGVFLGIYLNERDSKRMIIDNKNKGAVAFPLLGQC